MKLKYLGVTSLAALAVAVMSLMSAAAGHALAESDDPAYLANQLYEFLRSGRGTAAVGVVSTIVVYLLRRALAPHVRWFGTTLGGYALNLGTSTISYVGAAIAASQDVTASLLLNAVGAAFAASGGWEALKDVMARTGRPITTAVTGAALVAILFGATATSPGCSHEQRAVVAKIAADTIDCTADDDVLRVGSLSQMMLDATGGDWALIRDRLRPLGPRLGLCLGAAVLRARQPSALEGGSPVVADAPLEPLKREWGVRAVRTRAGNL